MASGSAAVETGKNVQADVNFTASQSSDLNKCLTVKVVYGDTDDPSSATTTQTYVYDAASGAVTKKASALQADGTVNVTTPVKVTVYIYFDGEHTDCTTAKAINLAGITVDLTFTVNETLHS